MSRLNQIIRNSYIRLEGLLYQVFGFFNKLLGWLNQGFKFLGKLLGFTSSQYLVETDETQAIKAAKAEPELTAAAPQSSPSAASTTRRRPDPSMDYFLKMAQQEKKGKKAT